MWPLGLCSTQTAAACCPGQHSHSLEMLWQGVSQRRARLTPALQCHTAGRAFSFVQGGRTSVCARLQSELCARAQRGLTCCPCWTGTRLAHGCGPSDRSCTTEESVTPHPSAPISSRQRRRTLFSHVHVQSQASALQQWSFSLSRMSSDKTGELNLSYVWFWVASPRPLGLLVLR